MGRGQRRLGVQTGTCKRRRNQHITVKFQQVPPEHIREEIFSQAAEMFGPDKTDKDKETETRKKKRSRIHN